MYKTSVWEPCHGRSDNTLTIELNISHSDTDPTQDKQSEAKYTKFGLQPGQVMLMVMEFPTKSTNV